VSIPRIKKGDTVAAIAGVNAGKSGKVLQVIPAKNRVLVEGVNLGKKTLRKTQETPQGGIVEKEKPMALSNVLLYCPECKKGVRTGRAQDGERRTRKCKACGHAFDS
jgi:large subunit ribosomal protein L24